jgi:hypothetical protein
MARVIYPPGLRPALQSNAPPEAGLNGAGYAPSVGCTRRRRLYALKWDFPLRSK